MNIIGYSERGAINSLLYEIYFSPNAESLLSQLFSRITFPFLDEPPIVVQDAQVLIEQSFSDFGDADAVFLINTGIKKISIFLEAKVKSYQKAIWSIQEEFNKFKNNVNSKVSSSNLFVQLYHKLILFYNLKDANFINLKVGVKFPYCSSKQMRKIGNNEVVLRAVEMVKGYIDSDYYVALVPDSRLNVTKFYENILKNFTPEGFQRWNCSRYGFLVWEDIREYCYKNNLKNTLELLKYNEGQIF